eukprot:TRINITY_DN27864_c0_g1_i1.p2 TRINITY_DN27864_c0_g1~~TRINITY_DN27864_c0_g1_i1.p2  ORF type:complete len:148 (+),score=37.08 TRINITY_DN27864_c0_g1_i1:81-524(+)
MAAAPSDSNPGSAWVLCAAAGAAATLCCWLLRLRWARSRAGAAAAAGRRWVLKYVRRRAAAPTVAELTTVLCDGSTELTAAQLDLRMLRLENHVRWAEERGGLGAAAEAQCGADRCRQHLRRSHVQAEHRRQDAAAAAAAATSVLPE